MRNLLVKALAATLFVTYITSFNYGGCGKSISGSSDTGSSTPTPAPTAPAQVTTPLPSDGTTGVITTTQFSWASASGATSYDVYFGVTTTAWASVTNTVSTSYPISPSLYATTYYWRIDSKNSAGTTTGIVWSFTTQIAPPAQVTTPNPANSAISVITTTQLSWVAATGATSYDVYFSAEGGSASGGGIPTSWTPVTNTVLTSFSPSVLSWSTPYYWRIDSKNSTGTTTGVVWSFATASASWTRQLGSSDWDYAYAVATDANGNIYAAGKTDGGLDGNTNAGSGDLFVVKYDPAGLKQWTRQSGTSASEYASGAATDTAGNIYVAGYTSGGLDGNTNAGSADLFVVKYDSAGVKQWTRQLGTSANDAASGVATDTAGNIYVAGTTDGGLDGNTNSGGDDLFVVKYDSAGVKQWTRQLDSTAYDYAWTVATDTAGNIYAAGKTDGGLDGNTNSGGDDLFVVKYDSAGVKQWTKQLGTSAGDWAFDVATDTAGNIYVAGATYGGLDGNTNVGSADLFVVKYDSAGVKQWTRQLGTSAYDHALAVATDTAGNIYAAGKTDGGLDGNINAGGDDLFVVKYNTDGVKQWTRQSGTSAEDAASEVVTDASGNIYVAGVTVGGLDGNTSAGSADLFVVKYNSAGEKQ